MQGEEMNDFMPDLFEFEDTQEVDKTDDVDTSTEELDTVDSDEINHIEAHTRWFAEKNGIDIPDNTEITEEYFEEISSKYYSGQVSNPLDNIPVGLKDVFEIAINENLSKEDLLELITVKEQTELKVDNESNAEAYLKTYYKDLGDTEEEIEEKIASLKDKDKLIDRAERLSSKDKTTSEKYINQRLTNSRESLQQQQEEEVRFLKSFGEEVDNYGFKPNITQQVKESLQDTGKRIEKALSKPKSLAQLATLMQFAYDDKKGEFDFETFISKINPKNTKNRKAKNSLQTHLKKNIKTTPAVEESIDDLDYNTMELV